MASKFSTLVQVAKMALLLRQVVGYLVLLALVGVSMKRK